MGRDTVRDTQREQTTWAQIVAPDLRVAELRLSELESFGAREALGCVGTTILGSAPAAGECWALMGAAGIPCTTVGVFSRAEWVFLGQMGASLKRMLIFLKVSKSFLLFRLKSITNLLDSYEMKGN